MYRVGHTGARRSLRSLKSTWGGDGLLAPDPWRPGLSSGPGGAGSRRTSHLWPAGGARARRSPRASGRFAARVGSRQVSLPSPRGPPTAPCGGCSSKPT